MPMWTNRIGVHWHYIAPGKPQQNAFGESFNVLQVASVLATTVRVRSAALTRALCGIEITMQPEQ